MKRAKLRRPPRSAAVVEGLRPDPRSFPGHAVAVHRSDELMDDKSDLFGFVLVIDTPRGAMYVRVAHNSARAMLDELREELEENRTAHPRRSASLNTGIVSTEIWQAHRDSSPLLALTDVEGRQHLFQFPARDDALDLCQRLAINLGFELRQSSTRRGQPAPRRPAPRTAYDDAYDPDYRD